MFSQIDCQNIDGLQTQYLIGLLATDSSGHDGSYDKTNFNSWLPPKSKKRVLTHTIKGAHIMAVMEYETRRLASAEADGLSKTTFWNKHMDAIEDITAKRVSK